LTEIKGTFGLSDEQIKGLQKTLDKSTREQLSDNFQLREGTNPKNNPWEPFGVKKEGGMDANESQLKK
jgi:mRNA-degrading endonuclease RelE of RelBE toxin-antitoxin system